MAKNTSFPSTQASNDNNKIFVDSFNAPLPIYLDPSAGIPNRNKLIRLLKSSGASICHQVGDARIYLVDASSDSGKLTARDWGSDPNKVALDYPWVQACIKRGRALLGGDDWGGLRVVDDDDFVPGDEEEEDIRQPSLPTPRPTPIDTAAASRAPGPSSQTKKPISSASRPRQVPQPTPPSSQPSPPLYQRNPAGPSSSHPAPIPEFNPFQNSFLSSSYPMQNFSMPANASFQPMQLQNHFAIQNQMIPPNIHGVPPQLVLPTQYPFVYLIRLLETSISVARNLGLDTKVLQAFVAALPMPPTQDLPVPSHSSSSNANTPVSRSTGAASSNHHSHADGLNTLPSSSSSSSKRKSRVLDEDMESEHRPPLSKSERSKKPRSQLHGPKPVSATSTRHSSPAQGVFVANGVPIPIFVQVDYRNRRDIVQAIKKGGGRITADVPLAAYAVLSPRSDSFRSLQEQAQTHGRPIVKSDFIHDCIEFGALQDPQKYAVEETGSPKKPRRQSSSFLATSSRKPILDDNAPVANVSRAPSRDSSRTPEPPEPVKAPTGLGYGFSPAEQEYTWTYLRRLLRQDPYMNRTAFCKKLHEKMPWRSVNSWYAQIRKHGETWDTIQAETLPSTAQGRERPTGGTVETGDPSEGNSPADDEGVTHEGGEEDEFATAERLEEEDDVEANLEPLNQDVSALDDNEGFEGDKPTSDELQGFDIAVQADFEAIVEFLVSGDADEGGEEDVWPLLERRRACQTAPSWSAFLDRHVEIITKEVALRCSLQQDVPALAQ
ncbi:hypothetical protein BV25DRAFT_1911267 [Artomyces pyxidatus]|uniref:Uncharacterized protein n=1 Tax=Artomyces pyxidatus TaxID=48021 RepID=A0ACB8TIN0_9AGAM|nr:hypothetical protein BV25DRAFT_1911267 [Artomyces pyxidatus]